VAYTLSKLPDEPILIYAQQSQGNPMQDMEPSLADLAALLDGQREQVFVIYDVRTVAVDVDDILLAADHAARGSRAVLHHAMIRENLFVAQAGMLRAALRGLSSATFGQVRLALFDTVEEALAHCRRSAEDFTV